MKNSTGKATKSVQLESLRALRERVRTLGEALEENLQEFAHPIHTDPYHGTFIQKPKTKQQIEKKETERQLQQMSRIDVTSTATVLMALTMGNKLALFYDDAKKGQPTLLSVLKSLFAEKWTSGGLKDLNAFSTALVFRCFGFLNKSDRDAIAQEVVNSVDHQGQPYLSLVEQFGNKGPKASAEPPLAPTLAYWLLDAAEKLSWKLSAEAWLQWAQWASDEFHRQFSYVTAQDDASMDPVALAMAACLAAKIHKIAESGQIEPATARREVERALPSRERLKVALPELFKRQGKSGIWPKYFPLFVYPDGGQVNHCFAFELLEALLNEFPEELIEAHLAGMRKSVGWCEKYRIRRYLHTGDSKEYYGWNSGANLEGLREGYPESWATAVVHMFLFKLDDVLSRAIESEVLEEFRARRPKEKKQKDWDGIIEDKIDVSGKSDTVKNILMKEIFEEWTKAKGGDKRKRSALLFGPPGTSKTRLVKSFAKAIGWPCISIDPSHFLRDGMEKIYSRADEVFTDLMDVSDSVIFFDEMDPLMQERQQHSDILHQALTTVFLPKLADLYNRNRAIFFMATNHFGWFDSAIKRPGRFDFLLCVGPPSWESKLAGDLSAPMWERYGDEASRKNAADKLAEWTNGAPDIIEVLDLFTIGEMEALFDQLQVGGSLLDGLANLKQEEFRQTVLAWGKEYIILWKKDGTSSEAYKEYVGDKDKGEKGDKKKSKRQ